MEQLSDAALVVVIQNLRLALDYQHQRLMQAGFGEDAGADLEPYLVQVDLILGVFTNEYERRVAYDGNLAALVELPRITL